MKYLGILAVAVAFLACGSQPAPESAAAPEPPPPPRDESHRFPKEGLVETAVVVDHVLGREFLPPGNVARYDRDGKTYSMFLVTMEDGQQASMLSYNVKGRFNDAKFVPHFGGFFGLEGGEPWFIFPKNRALAGVVGLPEDEADQVARLLAGRMD